LYNQSGYFLVI
jgi:hypothetical protein